MSITGYDRQALLIAATTVAEGHWHRKGSKHPALTPERARCFGIADEFRELHDTLINEYATKAVEEAE